MPTDYQKRKKLLAFRQERKDHHNQLFWSRNVRKTMLEWMEESGPEDYLAMLERLNSEIVKLESYPKKIQEIHVEFRKKIQHTIDHPEEFRQKLTAYYEGPTNDKYLTMKHISLLFRNDHVRKIKKK